MTATLDATIRTGQVTIGTGLIAVGAVFIINAAALGTQLMFGTGDAKYSETSATTMHLVHYVVWTAGLVALSALIPRLSRIPAGVTAFVGVGATLEACTRFVTAFVNPYLAANEPRLLDEMPDAILLVPLLATGVLLMIGLVSLAVIAARRGVVPWTAAVLLSVGALAIPALGPVSNVILGAGLVWFGSATRRTAQA